MYKGYEFRIYPSPNQQILIKKTIGCTRKIWNLMLNDNNRYYEDNKKGRLNSPASYKTEYPYLKEVDSDALCNEWNNLKTAFSRFFTKTAGMPSFKRKNSARQSYTTFSRNGSVRFERGCVKLPKLGLIPIRLHRHLNGKIKAVTVKMSPTGKFFAVFRCELKPHIIESCVPAVKKILGIDMSLSGFGVTNEGVTFNPPKWFDRIKDKLALEQHRLSKKTPGSKNREKQKIKVAKVNETISWQKRDWLNNLSTQIASDYDVVVLEDINLKGMSGVFGKSVSQNGFGIFRRMLEYKMKDRLKEFVQVDRFYASTQLCSNCGFKNQEVRGLDKLGIREWTCPKCGTNHNRDVNAALNLVKYYNEHKSTDAMSGFQACGDDISPCRKRITKVVRRHKAVVREPGKREDRTDTPCVSITTRPSVLTSSQRL